MKITVSGGIVRVDGIQNGPKYSSHVQAIKEGKSLIQKYYPHASFIEIPIPPIAAQNAQNSQK